MDRRRGGRERYRRARRPDRRMARAAGDIAVGRIGGAVSLRAAHDRARPKPQARERPALHGGSRSRGGDLEVTVVLLGIVASAPPPASARRITALNVNRALHIDRLAATVSSPARLG